MRQKHKFGSKRWDANDTAFCYWASEIRDPNAKQAEIASAIERTEASVDAEKSLYKSYTHGKNDPTDPRIVRWKSADKLLGFIKTTAGKDLLSLWERKLDYRAPGKVEQLIPPTIRVEEAIEETLPEEAPTEKPQEVSTLAILCAWDKFVIENATNPAALETGASVYMAALAKER